MIVYMKRIAYLVGSLAALLLVACTQTTGPQTSSKIRPPEWIRGTWGCDVVSDASACANLARVGDLLGYAVTFTDKDVRQTDQATGASFVIFSDAARGLTQSATDTVYTITADVVSHKQIRTWTRTRWGLNYRFQATGQIEVDLQAPFTPK